VAHFKIPKRYLLYSFDPWHSKNTLLMGMTSAKSTTVAAAAVALALFEIKQ